MHSLVHRSVLMLAALCCCRPADAQSLQRFADILYRTDPVSDTASFRLDVYRRTPSSGPRPVIVFVHGGAWYSGSKNDVDRKAEFFTEHGYLFVSIDYRLSPYPPDTSRADRVMHPVHVNDAASAVRWVQDSIAHYGGDPSRIGLLGHSAGAFIVALLGTHPQFLKDAGADLSRVRCLCPVDIGGMDIPTWLTLDPLSREVYINAFGNTPEQWAAASPARNISYGAPVPPLLYVVQQTVPRILTGTMLVDSLRSRGYAAAALPMPGYDHTLLNTAIGDSSHARYSDTLLTFFDRYLTPGSAAAVRSAARPIDWSCAVYPNPFNPSTVVRYAVPERSRVQVVVYSMLGQRIASSPMVLREAGTYESLFDGASLSAGIYLCHVHAVPEDGRQAPRTDVVKMVLLK